MITSEGAHLGCKSSDNLISEYLDVTSPNLSNIRYVMFYNDNHCNISDIMKCTT